MSTGSIYLEYSKKQEACTLRYAMLLICRIYSTRNINLTFSTEELYNRSVQENKSLFKYINIMR